MGLSSGCDDEGYRMTHALILVDLQNDFMPGGALAVPGADETIATANRLLAQHSIVVATQDWHPADHGSFAPNHPGRSPGEFIELGGLRQVLWPTHCVQQSAGAEFVDGLDTDRITRVFRKGTDAQVDSYSGFFDNGRRHTTGMADWLRAQDVQALTVAGVATDYCVKFTALDAAELGFDVTLVRAGCRGVELKPGDVDAALAQMAAAGVALQ